MKLKKLLAMALAGALLIGGAITTNAAELDTKWYAEQNPDVVAALGNSPKALKQHYAMYGRKEGRMANTHDVEAKLRKLFKAEEYGVMYPDVKEAFGDDAEAMFKHYISYGLLETRRPGVNVTYEEAVSLKTAVEKAFTDAGLTVKPGSANIVAVIEGTVSKKSGNAKVVQALTEVTAVVEKAVTETYQEVTAPKPAPSNNSGGSKSSSGGGSGTTKPDDKVDEETCKNGHDWSNKDGVCKTCKTTCKHDWSNKNGTCKTCGMACPNHKDLHQGKTCECGVAGTVAHEYKDGVCTCGAEDPDAKKPEDSKVEDTLVSGEQQ